MDDDALKTTVMPVAARSTPRPDGDDTPVGIIRPIDPPARPARRSSSRTRDGDRDRQPGRRRRRRPALRRTIIGSLLVVLALLGYYLISLYQVWSTGRADQARPVDAIVVLGAAQYDGEPSPQLAARLDQVVRLWPQGIAPIVFTTGGSRPGDRFTEAEASAAYLAERGVPADAILVESSGSDTLESMDAVAAELAQRGLGSVLIVTDPYHALRSRLIAEEAGLDAYVSPTTTSVVRGGSSLKRHLLEAGGVMVGRITGFDRL